MSYTTTTEAAATIRAALKARGWNARKVSVRASSYSTGSSIRVEIKSADVPLSIVEAIANGEEQIDRCGITGEILSGGNRFVTVQYDPAALRELVEPIDALLAAVEYDPGQIVEIGAWRAWTNEHDRGSWNATAVGVKSIRCWGREFCARQIAIAQIEARHAPAPVEPSEVAALDAALNVMAAACPAEPCDLFSGREQPCDAHREADEQIHAIRARREAAELYLHLPAFPGPAVYPVPLAVTPAPFRPDPATDAPYGCAPLYDIAQREPEPEPPTEPSAVSAARRGAPRADGPSAPGRPARRDAARVEGADAVRGRARLDRDDPAGTTDVRQQRLHFSDDQRDGRG